MSEKEKSFGKLTLSVQGTSNGRGFDILYDFKESFDFTEAKSKNRFLFIQPWMQFPNEKYTDECKLVSIELVSRFNDYPKIAKENKRLRETIVALKKSLNENA